MNACLKIPNIRFRAVVDVWEAYNLRRAHRMLQKFGHKANAYIDYREMLAKEKGLDAVLIATPDFWHAEHTVECLKAGLHVYCEKEMSNTLEGARRMVLAARQTKKLLQIGHQRRSNPRYLHSLPQADHGCEAARKDDRHQRTVEPLRAAGQRLAEGCGDRSGRAAAVRLPVHA